MSCSECEELLDIDTENQYYGRECHINFDTTLLHDYEGLVEFSDGQQYLAYYRGCGFDESEWDHPELIQQEYVVEANRSLCKRCPHSAKNRAGCLDKKYWLPNTKEKYLSCPLEEDFAIGTAFTLRYPRLGNRVCQNCGKTVKDSCDGGKAQPKIYDVRFQGHPSKLFITREQEKCPFCGQRLPAVEIPGVQVNSTLKFSERLIRAISVYNREKGISGIPQKMIAQGYGITHEVLRQYLGDKRKQVLKTAEENYRKRIRDINKSQGSRHTVSEHGTQPHTWTYYFSDCTTVHYSLALYFSSFGQTERELSPSAAFDKREVDVIDTWVHGDFSSKLPAVLSDDHLTVLAHCYAATACSHLNQTLAFDMVELTIAYGKFLQSHRGASEDMMITDALRSCLEGLVSGDMPLSAFQDGISQIYGWSMYCRKGRIMKAARKLLTFLDRSPSTLGLVFQPLSALPRNDAEPNLQEKARHMGVLIEQSLMENTQRQDNSLEDPEERYEANPDLAILRLLYINPAAPVIEEENVPTEMPLPGIPVRRLEQLLREGLLDNRGSRPVYQSPNMGN